MRSEEKPLSERVRELLQHESSLREVAMFGGRSFMVQDQIIVAARTDGSLLVRIDPPRRRDLMTRPGAQPATMGRNARPMGPNWMTVAPEGLVGGDLEFWVLEASFRPHSSRE